jgi:hypothetical protein
MTDISVRFGRWVFFENLRGPRPLNLKKLFSAASDKKNVAYPFSCGSRCQ